MGAYKERAAKALAICIDLSELSKLLPDACSAMSASNRAMRAQTRFLGGHIALNHNCLARKETALSKPHADYRLHSSFLSSSKSQQDQPRPLFSRYVETSNALPCDLLTEAHRSWREITTLDRKSPSQLMGPFR